MTGIRLSENEVRKHATHAIARWYSLSDKFGDYGIVSVVLAHVHEQELILDAWVLSCRAFQRTVEEFVLRNLIQCAKEQNCIWLSAQYRRTGKPSLFPAVLEKFSFQKVGEDDGKACWYRRPVFAQFPPMYIQDVSEAQK